ncbi:MAG TPA: transcriptional repressor LexA [Candidatus Peribacterales bacterium]|nr:transcriptional repressor LexA [Candidatus Peribacterales bacterium]
MSSSLSPAQAEILDFYRKFMRQNERAPSLGEVAEKLGRDRSNILYHLKNIERMGLLVRTGGHRGVRLVSKSSKIIPLLGVVACGEPITILEEIEENVQIPENMISDGYAHYALRAKGDSMIGVGIFDGDILVIRKQPDVQDGDIAVIATDEPPFEAVTLKRAFHKKKSLLLKPENDELEPYVVKKGDVRGKLVGVIRSL